MNGEFLGLPLHPMSDPYIQPIPPSLKARDRELANEFRRIEKRDWWVWGYSIFVIFLLAFAVIALALPAVREGADTIFKIKMTAKARRSEEHTSELQSQSNLVCRL